MCNDHTLRNEARARREQAMSRRDFNLLALSAAAVALLPTTSSAASVKGSVVAVKTPDGTADCFLAHPTEGKHPGVLLWPDFMGRRPAYEQMATRLAESGYAVLVMNPYYRGAKAPILEKADFDNEAAMKQFQSLSKEIKVAGIVSDAKACVAFLDAQAAVDTSRRIGTVGYCYGGSFAFRTAAAVPDRVGAVATFHAGGLVSEKPGSPHLLIPEMKAQALIGIAESDVEYEPKTKGALSEAFDKAKLAAEIEVYAGASHGWCTPDMVAYYNEAQALRAWSRLLALFGRALV
jgi:carboxymethylenebutenolidase